MDKKEIIRRKPAHLRKVMVGVRISEWVIEEMRKRKIPQGKTFEALVIKEFGLKMPKKLKKLTA